jgi:hypothetical protein
MNEWNITNLRRWISASEKEQFADGEIVFEPTVRIQVRIEASVQLQESTEE